MPKLLVLTASGLQWGMALGWLSKQFLISGVGSHVMDVFKTKTLTKATAVHPLGSSFLSTTEDAGRVLACPEL